MQLPFFFEENLPVSDEFNLTEETSKHIVQVLRMHETEELMVTNGKGETLKAFITAANKKKTAVKITGRSFSPVASVKVSVAISPVKNKSRFEWFLEKATELGVSEIIPLKSARTEKQQFRMDRMKSILESALIQSQQVWMPILHEPQNFNSWVENVQADQKFVAHCEDGEKRKLSEMIEINSSSQLILIGPEGDFTDEEINLAISHQFVAVELGVNRLRSETAAVAAAAVLKLC